jgi:tetratricopeptide (TPR) repeat protein
MLRHLAGGSAESCTDARPRLCDSRFRHGFDAVLPTDPEPVNRQPARPHKSHPRAKLAAVAGALLAMAATLHGPLAQTPPATADHPLARAFDLEKNKDFAGAEALYRQALVASPDDPEILKRLGLVCQQQGKHQESIATFGRILKRAPLYPGVNGLLAVSYYALNRFNEAAEASRKELTGNPRDRQARYYLALALTASGHLFAAIQQLEALLTDDPEDAAVMYQLAVDYKAAAQQAGLRLGTKFPDSPFTHALNAEVYADGSRLDEAILEFKEVLRKSPDFPGIHFALGQVYWRKKEYDTALEQLNLALQEDPNQPLANYYLADILVTRSAFQQAVPHLQAAISAVPTLARAHFLLGKCHAGTGELQHAREALSKALELDPKYLEAHYQLHQIYARLGDKEKSQKHLQTFQELTKEGQEKDTELLRESYRKQEASKANN